MPPSVSDSLFPVLKSAGGFREIALQRRGERVVVGIANFARQQLLRAGHAQQPHRGFPLAGIGSFGNLREGQFDI